MAVVRKLSVLYVVTTGRYKGKVCNIHKDNFRSRKLALIAIEPDSLVVVKKKNLAQLNKPGWFDDFPYITTCTLQEDRKNNSIHCAIRDAHVVQPRAMQMGDVLASGEVVTKKIRRGYNSSVLIHLSKTGWVELAPRLPIALQGNSNFKLASEVRQDDRLATGCCVIEGPASTEANWSNVYLNRVGCCIDTPACIPLALA